MTAKILAFALSIILVASAVTMAYEFIPEAEADKAKGTPAKQYGSATKSKVCGDRLCSEPPREEEPKEKMKTTEEETESMEEETKSMEEQKREEVKTEKKTTEQEKATKSMEEQTQAQVAMALPPWQTKSETITSSQDPGIGHESHQLAVILPPSDKVYRGQLTYSASENIQLVALHGPLEDGQDAGQPIWTPDGKTKFALTLVDPENQMGTWRFAGNALAVHTFNEDPFTLTYSVTYRERIPSDLVVSSTLHSEQDPGIGHESHQLAIIMPPSERTYNGVLTYSSSEPIQLIALHGPLLPGQDNGQPIWTPDGKTKFALTLVDNQQSMGSWTFSGNAIAVHTLKPDEFTVSYSVVAGS